MFADCAEEQDGPAQTESAFCERLDEAWALNDLHKTDEAFEIALKALDA